MPPCRIALALGCFFLASVAAPASTPNERYNVLFIAVDDLRPELGCYGAREIKTPNIDRLAAAGTIFNRHYVQFAICAPSRASLLTGTRQGSGNCWARWRSLGTEPEQPISLPHLFRRNGYRTVAIGKISHQPGGVLDREGTIHEVPFSWDLSYAPVGKWKTPWAAFFSYADGTHREYGYGADDRTKAAYEAADVPDTGYADGLNAEEATRQLADLAGRPQPFFLAVGFYKPHLPFNAPKRYWDLYRRDQIPVAPNPYPPEGIDAAISLHKSYEVTSHYGWPGGLGQITPDQAQTLRHGYYACVSYTDAQIGKVLDALERHGLDNSTVVVLWGDHGWHLGDHGMFGKDTNFEVATRSPLLIRVPRQPHAGQKTDVLAETVDIYPTLADLCGLDAPGGLPGQSLRPAIADPAIDGQPEAMSFLNTRRGPAVVGFTLRTDRYRLVEWVTRSERKTVQLELYDHGTDPNENTNIAVEQPAVVARLLRRLRAYYPTLENVY